MRKLAIFAFGLWCGSWAVTLQELLANGYQEGIFFTHAIISSISVLILFYALFKCECCGRNNEGDDCHA